MCTGFVDKNGRDIYEDDVVLLRGDDLYHDETLRIEWGRLGGFYGVGWTDDDSYLDTHRLPLLDVEVIGNVHETLKMGTLRMAAASLGGYYEVDPEELKRRWLKRGYRLEINYVVRGVPLERLKGRKAA